MEPMISIKKMLVPVDFSDCSRAALDYAIYFGNRLESASIDVLHVWRPPVFVDLDTKVQGPEGREQTLAEFAGSRAGQAMKEFLAEIEAGGAFEVHGRLESGEPFHTVLEVATEEEYDLIIMGTHGESKSFKLGSIAQKVVRNATIPVLTIRTPEAE
jgi:nucleotide-binding universal stress UspA family protein